MTKEEENEVKHNKEDRTDENESNEERIEPHTISEDIPAPRPERVDRQNIQQNRKTLKPMTATSTKCQILMNGLKQRY